MEGGFGGVTGSLFGRADEIRLLVDAIDADRPIVVVGEVGIGKTSTVRGAAAAAGRPIHEGGGFATLAWMPYLPLTRATGRPLAGDPAGVAAELERRVGPDLLFVDDLQWVDRDTLSALGLSLGRILVAVAIREGGAEAARLIEPFVRAGATVVHVGGLGEDDAAALVRRLRPDATDHLVDGIVRRAAGNPLLLEELTIRGEASPVLERAIVSRVGSLSPAGRSTVDLLAVADRPLPRTDAGAGVAEAVGAGLVVERGLDVEIRHALVADAIRSGLDPADRRAIHDRLADLVTDQGEAARELAAAGRPAEAAAVALEAIAESTDPRERAALLVIAAEASPPDREPGLRLGAARALDELSDWPAVIAVLDGGETWDPEEQAEREAVLAHAAFGIGDIGGCHAHLEVARALTIDPAGRAATRRAIEEATIAVNLDGAPAAAIAILDAMLAVPPGHPADRRDVEILRASIAMLATGSLVASLLTTASDEAFAEGRYRTATDRARVLQYLLLMGAGSEPTLVFLLSQRERFEAAGVASVAQEFLADAAQAALLAGSLGRAIALSDEVLERPTPTRPRQLAEIVRAWTLGLMGRFDDAAAAVAAIAPTVTSDWFGRGLLLAAEAEIALWSGRPADTIELATAAFEIPAPIPVAHVQPTLTRAWARFELGHDPGPGLDIPLPPSLAGALPEHAGLGALHAGDEVVAASAFDEALARWAGFHETRAILCRWAAGEARRRAGDRDRALVDLEAALGAASAIGFEPVAARARRSLRQAGVRVPGARRSGTTLGSGLTARERELVDLVEQGLSNTEIARRLGLGRPTVARILSSAMLKVGASRRTQLGALARDR